jgi:hypothetical protein
MGRRVPLPVVSACHLYHFHLYSSSNLTDRSNSPPERSLPIPSSSCRTTPPETAGFVFCNRLQPRPAVRIPASLPSGELGSCKRRLNPKTEDPDTRVGCAKRIAPEARQRCSRWQAERSHRAKGAVSMRPGRAPRFCRPCRGGVFPGSFFRWRRASRSATGCRRAVLPARETRATAAGRALSRRVRRRPVRRSAGCRR